VGLITLVPTCGEIKITIQDFFIVFIDLKKKEETLRTTVSALFIHYVVVAVGQDPGWAESANE
jgi:hypothetical protein